MSKTKSKDSILWQQYNHAYSSLNHIFSTIDKGLVSPILDKLKVFPGNLDENQEQKLLMIRIELMNTLLSPPEKLKEIIEEYLLKEDFILKEEHVAKEVIILGDF